MLEEKKSFLEAQDATAVVNFPQSPRRFGNSDEDGRPLLASVVPLDPSAIAQVIAERLRRLDVATASIEAASASLISALARSDQTVPLRRSPFFCSGCPHNRSTQIPGGSLSITAVARTTMANLLPHEKANPPLHMGAEGRNRR